MKLRRLNNEEFDRVDALARASGKPLDECQTCGSRPIEVAPGVWGRTNGSYRLFDKTYPCDCETQMKLRKAYLAAGIPDGYHRIDWSAAHVSQPVREAVDAYLDHWEPAKRLGMGVEFWSKGYGTGKTTCATYIGRELVKQGVHVYFVTFREILNLLDKESTYRNRQEEHLRTVTVLILDDIKEPTTTASADYFRGRLEEFVRHRTSFNFPTIVTTNITPGDLEKLYPECYSLLAAKNQRIELEGEDARQHFVRDENEELKLNFETRPIV